MDYANVFEKLRAAFPAAVLETSTQRDATVRIAASSVVQVARFLRDDPQLSFNFLENLCGVDYLGRDPRFEVVYHLLSHANRARICLKVGLPEVAPHVATLTDVWVTANWQEREAFDMFGIIFDGHPALDRILMPDDWQGYPLRKDVPLGGEEVAFTINQDRIYARKPFATE